MLVKYGFTAILLFAAWPNLAFDLCGCVEKGVAPRCLCLRVAIEHLSTFSKRLRGIGAARVDLRVAFESRLSHFSFLFLAREIYAHVSEHSRSRGCPFTRQGRISRGVLLAGRRAHFFSRDVTGGCVLLDFLLPIIQSTMGLGRSHFRVSGPGEMHFDSDSIRGCIIGPPQ